MNTHTDLELRRYDRMVGKIVAAARLRFLANRENGKTGWDNPKEWRYPGLPLDSAIEECREASECNDIGLRLWELGDTLNYLAFDLAVQEALTDA